MRLQNQDIWLAYPKLVELSRLTLPSEASLGIADLIKKLQQPYIAIENERKELVRLYGIEDKKTHQINAGHNTPGAGAFAVAFGELLIKYWEDDIPIGKVKLPKKITGLCENCGHEMEVIFLIHPQTLVPLVENFVEVSDESS